MANPFATATYVLAAHLPRQLPPDTVREVAFAGRSNAGKSTALNALCHQNRLAKTSKTPGRTQQLVYFLVQPDKYLVDLPGYGYAKVPEELRAHWLKFINTYFETRASLAGLVVVMDVRHPLREYDLQMLNYAKSRGLPAHCLLTKSDKLGRGEQAKILLGVRKQLKAEFGDMPGEPVGAQLYSGDSRLGVDEARAVVARWLGL